MVLETVEVKSKVLNLGEITEALVKHSGESDYGICYNDSQSRGTIWQDMPYCLCSSPLAATVEKKSEEGYEIKRLGIFPSGRDLVSFRLEDYFSKYGLKLRALRFWQYF